MIPEFDGTAQSRVRKFLSASDYAMKNIKSTEEQILIEVIVCIKLKGKALLDFHIRDVRSYEQLRTALESEYLSKCSTSSNRVQFTETEKALKISSDA